MTRYKITEVYADDDDDRISALPEPLIHHILSFLLPTIKDLKVFSSLSKTWFQYCSSFPDLDFHGSPFYHHSDEYLNFIDKTLRTFHHQKNNLNLQIHRLTIPITILHCSSIVDQINHLNSWIEIVLRHGVHEFNLLIKNPLVYLPRYDFSQYDFPLYDLPREVFASKEIKVAMLEGISLLHSFPSPSSSSGCNFIRKLCLDNVLFDELIFPCIISTCPLIEELSLLNCLGIKRIRVSSLDKLKTLRISRWLEKDEEETIMVEVDSPSLQSLEIEGPLEIRVLECPKLTSLDLNYVVLKELRLEEVILRLSFLRSLSLSMLFSSTKVNFSSHALHKLMIFRCCDTVELDINALNLLSAGYNGDFAPLASTSMFKVMGGQLGGSSGYCILVNPYTVEEFLDELRNFISKGIHFEYLSVYIHEFQPFCFRELSKRVIDQPAIGNVQDLELCIKNVSRISYLDLFESVLWICHPRTLTLQLDHTALGNVNKNFVNCICKIIMRGHPARKWLQWIKDVRYVSKDGTDGRLPIDGTSVPHLCSSYEEIKFIFRW